jgi:hypothetical protein
MVDWNAIRDLVAQERAVRLLQSDQMTLGRLIDWLTLVADQSLPVVFDFGPKPTTLASWRGIYAELALGYDDVVSPPTVAELLAECRRADGTTFTGWKGGDFTMGRETAVWVANRGETSDGVFENGYRAIVRLWFGDGGVVIETGERDT